MAYVYTVEFRFGEQGGDSLPDDGIRKHILADDRYEAVQLAASCCACRTRASTPSASTCSRWSAGRRDP